MGTAWTLHGHGMGTACALCTCAAARALLDAQVLLRRLDGVESSATTTLIAATNRRADLDVALLSRFDVRVHFAAPHAAGRASIFGLYAKQLPAAALEALGVAAEGLSGRDILDVCRAAERRWVGLLLRGEVHAPPLPPRHAYEEALRTRQRSGRDEDDEPRAAPGRGAGLSLATA